MRQLYIFHDNVIYEPAVAEKVKWQTERKNSPGRLEFKALADERMLSVSEGDLVTFSEDGEHLFYGYVSEQLLEGFLDFIDGNYLYARFFCVEAVHIG